MTSILHKGNVERQNRQKQQQLQQQQQQSYQAQLLQQNLQVFKISLFLGENSLFSWRKVTEL